jgi:6-phosphogluconolactonase
MQFIIKESARELFREAGEHFARAVLESIGPVFSAALSGGSTARGLLKTMKTDPLASRIPWSNLDLWWVDERCVPFESPHSNFGNARKDLLDHLPLSAGQLHPMPAQQEPWQGAMDYEHEMISAFGLRDGQLPVFDLIFLGIGPDGHVASIFPGSEALDERKKLVTAVKGGDPNVYRLTLTLPVLNQARLVLFVVSGAKKAETLRSIFSSAGTGGLPAAMVNPVHGRVTWIVDRDAASLFPAQP